MKCDKCGFTWTNENFINCPMCEFIQSATAMVDRTDISQSVAKAFAQDISDPDDIPMSDDDFSANETELLSL